MLLTLIAIINKISDDKQCLPQSVYLSMVGDEIFLNFGFVFLKFPFC
jgi:hypothetical protein